MKPKTNPATQIAVFGDSLAELLAQGLDNAYESSGDVVVIRRAKGDSASCAGTWSTGRRRPRIT